MQGSSPEQGPPCHHHDSLSDMPWLKRKAEEGPREGNVLKTFENTYWGSWQCKFTFDLLLEMSFRSVLCVCFQAYTIHTLCK